MYDENKDKKQKIKKRKEKLIIMNDILIIYLFF